MFNLKSYLISKFHLISGKATKYVDKPTVTQEIINKLDFIKIQELLIMQYSERMLDTMEKELNDAYIQGKNYEATLTLHSKEHHNLIDQLQKINKDLEKIQIERAILKKKTKINMDKLKQDLGVSNYVFKKITK